MTPDTSDSSWRYEASEDARRYGARKQRRLRREAALLERILQGVPPIATVLDVPCGTGRLAPLFVARGARYLGCDAAEGMLEATRTAGWPAVQGRLPALPFGDRAFDAVVCFRYLHHVPFAEQPALVRALARVARSQLVISGFHPSSTHEWRRRATLALSGRPRGRYPTPPRRLLAWLDELGFTCAAQAREGLLRDLWVARFERRQRT